jgi:hypothetical protein
MVINTYLSITRYDYKESNSIYNNPILYRFNIDLIYLIIVKVLIQKKDTAIVLTKGVN